jgi:hypothetical protein
MAFTVQTPGLGIGIAAVAAAAVIISFVAIVLRLTRATTVPRWLVVLGAALFAVPIFTVLILVGLTLSIVVAFAQRAIVVENIGPIDALQSGWRLTRAHVGESGSRLSENACRSDHAALAAPAVTTSAAVRRRRTQAT